jgi:MOSC domain-containing protein YiiM
MSETSNHGRIVDIHVAPEAGGAPRAVEAAVLVAGRGIVGDRYHAGQGTFSPETMKPDYELTLIESEQIERFNTAHGMDISAGAFRRNVVTRGVDLNALVGREFQMGEAVVRGIRLCEPCTTLAGTVGHAVLQGMVHRAGLRAGIVVGATVRPGDPIIVPAAKNPLAGKP